MTAELVTILLAASLMGIALMLWLGGREVEDAFSKQLELLRESGASAASQGDHAETRMRHQARREIALKLDQMLDLRRWFGSPKAKQHLLWAGKRQAHAETMFVVSRFLFSMLAGSCTALYAFSVEADVWVVALAAMVGIYAGMKLRDSMLLKAAKSRQEAIARAWPDFIDSVVICLMSGMSFEAALQRVLNEMMKTDSPLVEELIVLSTELQLLPDRLAAFNNLAMRTDVEEIRAAATALGQSWQFGSPLSEPLSALALEGRKIRKAKAERDAERMAPLMTGLSVVFFVPVTAVVALAPVLIRFLGSE